MLKNRTIPAHMQIRFQGYDVKNWLEKAAHEFRGELQQDCQEYFLELPAEVGKGYLKSYSFRDGISLLLIDAHFRQAMKMVVENGGPHPLHFHFCAAGQFRHSLGKQDTTYQLQPFHGSITSSPGKTREAYYFPEGQPILYTDLQIVRGEYIQRSDCKIEEMPDRLARAFEDVNSREFFLYETDYSIAISDCIQQLSDNPYRGLVRSSFSEAKAIELLSLQLKQFAERTAPNRSSKTLKRPELEKIREARRLLVDELSEAPTIPELSRRSGINQQKLKQGFKEVYGTTIYKYLQRERMEAAKYLLMEGELSVGEIAHRVGYSNQSHFARRFKQHYGLSPRKAMAQYTELQKE